MKLKNLKKVKFKWNELTQQRVMFGLQLGVLVGMAGAGVIIIIYSTNLWQKIFIGLGFSCAIALQVMGLVQRGIQYKAMKNAEDIMNEVAGPSIDPKLKEAIDEFPEKIINNGEAETEIKGGKEEDA